MVHNFICFCGAVYLIFPVPVCSTTTECFIECHDIFVCDKIFPWNSSQGRLIWMCYKVVLHTLAIAAHLYTRLDIFHRRRMWGDRRMNPTRICVPIRPHIWPRKNPDSGILTSNCSSHYEGCWRCANQTPLVNYFLNSMKWYSDGSPINCYRIFEMISPFPFDNSFPVSECVSVVQQCTIPIYN